MLERVGTMTDLRPGKTSDHKDRLMEWLDNLKEHFTP